MQGSERRETECPGRIQRISVLDRFGQTFPHMVAHVSYFIMWFTALQTLHVYMSMFCLRVYHDGIRTLAYAALVRPVGRRAGPPALGQVTPAAGGWAPGCSSLFQIVTSTSAPAAARAATVHSDITCLCVKRARPEVPRLEVLLQAPAGQSLSWQLFCDISKSTT